MVIFLGVLIVQPIVNMTKYNLFIDDERFPVGGTIKSAFELTGDKRYYELEWVIVRNFEDFVKTIEENGLPDVISFDHDLKDAHYHHYQIYTVFTGKIDYTVVEGTGYECAKWLCRSYLPDHDLDFPTTLIHTENTVGRANIIGEIRNYRKSRGQ